MKLLMARLGLRGIDRFGSLLGKGRLCSSIPRMQSIHLATSTGRMGSPTHPRDPSDSPATGVSPRWVMLNREGRPRRAPVAKTTVDTSAYQGGQLRVSLDLVPPPVSSFLFYDWAPNDEEYYREEVRVMGTHGDSVLVHVRVRRGLGMNTVVVGYMVYRAGAARPPTVTLVSAPDIRSDLALYEGTTGLLRRGEDELLVVVLGLAYKTTGPRSTADLFVLRLGTSHWDHKPLVPIVLDEGMEEELQRWCLSEMVVPVGERFLCWVNYRRGFLLSDMAEASPKLRYVPLPVAPYERKTRCSCCYNDEELHRRRNMCTAGAAAVRFVTVDRRCCCGNLGRSICRHGNFSFTVTTWTLSRLSTDTDESMAWVKDSVMDCEELWALPGYEDLPRADIDCPLVSPVNPDIVVFKVYAGHRSESKKAWMIQVDTRAKTLLSVVQCTAKQWWIDRHFPVKLQS